ncbi:MULTISPECIES: antirestriction protein ArdA [Streptomyces]|uniref:antirestriction protein ArdA n=1 Tax=Streptomyces TaxID=1883 RepID=UPI001E635593|nr:MULTISPECIES: antirestriction protein ArdA [Streptomyces]UFQ16444.1 antirestriction protein ArdA [Streptomyces huasconensis]WCL86046.1 antirestriction protein ArdA [Streptomyces sp. JCM 35825]
MSHLGTPAIYVASLADYTAGRLHGAWIDADQDADDIRAEIADMLAASPTGDAEDYAIHDSENFGMDLPEYISIDDVAKLAELVTQHPPELVAHFRGEGYALDDIAEQIQERSRGTFESFVDFAHDWIGSGLPSHVEEYRWSLAKAVAHDWDVSGAYFTITTHDGVAVLSND